MCIDKIASKVNSFVDDIITNKVDEQIILAHKIPSPVLDVARSNSHPSQHKMRDRIYQKIMRNIGCYDRLSDQTGLNELLTHIDCALKNPECYNNIEEMFVPQFIYGVQFALDKIQSLSDCIAPYCSDVNVPHDAKFTKTKRGFSVAYQRDWTKNDIDGININNSHITIDGTDFIVPNNGSHLSKLERTFTSPDRVEIFINQLVSPNINSSDKKYILW